MVRPCSPSNQEANDETDVEQLSRRDRRSDTDGDGLDDAHGRPVGPAAVVSWRHMHRLTSSSRANDLKR